MNVTVGICNNWYLGFKVQPCFFTLSMLCVYLSHDDLYPQELRPE